MPTCFVIMPITTPAPLVERYGGDDDHFLHVLEFLFTPALEEAGYTAISPVASGSDLIQAEIIRHLDEADLALCDMTTLNANVFFELGIRTALNKPVATVKDSFTERIPFDHSMVNCHEYGWQMDPWVVRDEIPRLAAHVRAVVDRGGQTNTLWKRLGIEATAQVGSAGTGESDKLDYVVRQMEELRTRFDQGLVTPVDDPPPSDARRDGTGATASGSAAPPTSRWMRASRPTLVSLSEIAGDLNVPSWLVRDHARRMGLSLEMGGTALAKPDAELIREELRRRR
jgi:hypothetical protein